MSSCWARLLAAAGDALVTSPATSWGAALVAPLVRATVDADDAAKIEAMDADKRRKASTAKYPIEGLLFDTAGGVTLNGIPFDQCSSAEQLRVSVAIGIAQAGDFGALCDI